MRGQYDFSCLQVPFDSVDCINELAQGSEAAQTALAAPAQDVAWELNTNGVKVTAAESA